MPILFASNPPQPHAPVPLPTRQNKLPNLEEVKKVRKAIDLAPPLELNYTSSNAAQSQGRTITVAAAAATGGSRAARGSAATQAARM